MLDREDSVLRVVKCVDLLVENFNHMQTWQFTSLQLVVPLTFRELVIVVDLYV